MKTKTPEAHTPGIPFVQLNINFDVSMCKGNIFSRNDNKVYKLLCSGGEYSTIQMTNSLYVADPRSHIRNLRNAGVPIADRWIETESNSRYKVYFLKND